MIKINLAKRKQASYATGTAGAKTGTLTSLKALGASAESSDVISILTKILFPVALCVATYFAFNYYTDQKVEEFQNESTALNKDKTKIQGELAKIKGFENQKVELEKNSSKYQY